MQTKAFVAKQARLEELIREKDNFMVQFRKQSRLLTSEIEEHVAEGKVQAQIDAMSPNEQQAMRAGLAKGSS